MKICFPNTIRSTFRRRTTAKLQRAATTDVSLLSGGGGKSQTKTGGGTINAILLLLLLQLFSFSLSFPYVASHERSDPLFLPRCVWPTAVETREGTRHDSIVRSAKAILLVPSAAGWRWLAIWDWRGRDLFLAAENPFTDVFYCIGIRTYCAICDAYAAQGSSPSNANKAKAENEGGRDIYGASDIYFLPHSLGELAQTHSASILWGEGAKAKNAHNV